MNHFPTYTGNLICFKCRKIGYTQDCLNHPYKPWVFTIGVSSEDDLMNLEIIDEAAEDATGDVVTKGTLEENATVEDKDCIIDDLYDNINADIIDEDMEEHAESLGFNMLTFIDEANENYPIKLASAGQLKRLLTDEDLTMKLVNKPIQLMKSNSSQKTPSLTPATVELIVPNEVMKRSPPLLNAKLRLSQEARKYPSD